MAVDPNVYALSIQLQFDASEAFSTLDDFGQKVTDLEEEVSSAAQKAIQSLGQIAQEATKALGDIGKQLLEIDASTLKVQTNLADATKELKDQFDNGEDRLENLKEEFKIEEKKLDIAEQVSKRIEADVASNKKFMNFLDQIIAGVEAKNEGHKEQNGLLKTDNDLISKFNKALQGTGVSIKKNTEQAELFSISWRQVWGWIKKADEDTEKFTTTNYRHYGSQQQLVQGARNLAMANGIAYEQAVEAYAVMGNLKAPREEIDKYAKAVALANRTTGVGIQATGEYVNRLRTAGMSLQQSERNLALMGEAMRKFGLNTRDVNALMNQSANNAKRAALIFGRMDLEKWEKSRMIMAGFAREAGHSAEEMAQFENWILNDVAAMEVFTSTVGVSERGVDGYRMAMVRQGIAADNLAEQLEAARAAGEVPASLIAQEQAMINIYFGGSRAAYEAAKAQGKLAKAHGITGANVEEVNRLHEIYSNTLENQAAEANNTFTRQLKLLGDKVWAAAASVLQFIADALLPLLKALNWIAEKFGWVAGKINEFITWMESIPVIGKVVTFLKWAVGILMALGLAFLFVSGVVITFSTVLGGFSGLLGRMTAGVQAFANMLMILVRALGQAIVIILTSVGQGLQALGNSIKSVIVPLLALGAALLMAGIGAYFFAMGVKIVAEMGWAAIPALLGMIIAIGLLGLVLVGLAMLVQGPVAVGLIVLAVAILAVGIAAFLMGVGILMAAQGFAILSEVLSFGLILKFFVLGVAIVALGAMALIAVPGIYALGMGMILIAVAALIMAAAFWLVAAAIKMIGSEALPALADSLLQSALKFAAAGLMMIVAGAALIVGGIVLALALVIIGVVSVGLIVAGVLLLVGAAIMSVGAGLLMAAGVMILIGGLGMLIGGVGLYLGLLMINLSTPLMFAAGIALVIGASLMKAGAAALLTTGVMVMIGGVTMFIGGYLLVQAGQLLIQAVALFAQAGFGFIESAAQMLVGSVMLAAAGIFMVVAGVLLTIGGIALIAAGISLMIGLLFLSDSSHEMYGIGMRIGIGGLMMLAGAQALVTASSMLGESADHIDRGLEILKGLMPKVIEAAAMMMPAGMMLRVAALQLALGCIYVSVAGHALQSGVGPLLFGAIILQVAVGILAALAPSMFQASIWVLVSATLLLAASVQLLPAAILMAIAGGLLFTGTLQILWGSKFLMTAAIGLLIGSIIMVPAAQILLSAMQMLLPAAEMSLLAGQVLLQGSAVLLIASFMLLVATLALARASLVIVYTSALYLGAMMTMLVGSIFLSIAAKSIFNSAILLAVAGSLLPTAAMNILGAMYMLQEAGATAFAAGDELIWGSWVMAMAAEEIIWAAVMLAVAGTLMRPAAFAIYSGMMWLEFAVYRFSKTIDRVEKVAGAMSMLADAFMVLYRTPTRSLRDLSEEALGAIPNIERLGTGLTVAAKKLDEGVNAFQGPADRLNAILEKLTETITAFGQGLNLTDDVGRLADMLENYASLLEGASDRIETAVATKAVPAMRAAEEAGIEETVRSEAISTVQVVTSTDGEARDSQDEASKQLTKLNETMTVIKDTLVEMQSGGKGELSEILAVLQAYLPGLNKGDAGLGSELNSWAR